jgi:hypothetical protein
MNITAWSDGHSEPGYGLYVGISNLVQHFDRAWSHVEIEMDGRTEVFELLPGFWNKCPEIRDRGSRRIRSWLERHRSLRWGLRQRPRMELIPLGSGRFRLVA